MLAYFAWNAAVFGGLVPVSAGYKEFRSQLDWEQAGGYRLVENVREYLQSGFFDDELLVSLEICVYVALVWWFSRRSRGREDRLLLAFLVGVFGLAAGHLAKFAQGVLTMNARWGIWEWYFVPAYLMEALAVPTRCYVAVWFVRRFLAARGVTPAPRRARRAPANAEGAHLTRGEKGASTRSARLRASRIPSLGIVTAGAVFLAASADFTVPFRFVDRHRDSTLDGWPLYTYMGTMVMNRVLPDDAVVGSGGSGFIGYFSRFPVMNTDGMANSWDYLRARKEGTGAAFLQRHGITHFADSWPVSGEHRRFTLFEGPRHARGRYRFEVGLEEWLRGSWGEVDRADWFWERMEPHLEHRADGVGVLVDGRLAQAFARGCAPDETAVWTWGAGAGETIFLPWTQTSIGFCTSAIVLPRDARPPVRAAAMTAGEYLAGRVRGRRPAIDADFDVYLVENRLVYSKESCGPEDVDAPFFLHVEAVDPDDLPGPRRRHGFENLDFRFGARGARVEDACLVEAPLPGYGIAAIRTGQYVEVEGGFHRPWEGEIRLGADR